MSMKVDSSTTPLSAQDQLLEMQRNGQFDLLRKTLFEEINTSHSTELQNFSVQQAEMILDGMGSEVRQAAVQGGRSLFTKIQGKLEDKLNKYANIKMVDGVEEKIKDGKLIFPELRNLVFEKLVEKLVQEQLDLAENQLKNALFPAVEVAAATEVVETTVESAGETKLVVFPPDAQNGIGIALQSLTYFSNLDLYV